VHLVGFTIEKVKITIFKNLRWCLSYCSFIFLTSKGAVWVQQFICLLHYSEERAYKLHFLNIYIHSQSPYLNWFTGRTRECWSVYLMQFYSNFRWRFNFVNITGIISKGLKTVIILTVLERSVLPVWPYFC
jgi:hypothetical protein